MKLKAKEVQNLLNVGDNEIIAHGYDFDRNTIDIFFDKGKLIRLKTPYGKNGELSESEEFEPEFFTWIKRWYQGTPEKGINPTLVNLFETFGSPLPITPGGNYP